MSGTQLIDAYLAGLDSLQQAVEGLNAEQLRARPVPGMWSTHEVVCHLADSEGMFAERMKRVLSEDRPPLLFFDPDLQAASLAYAERDAAEDVALIGLVRRQMARILRAQPPTAWQRVGVHSVEGEKTLEQLVRKAIDHLEHHLSHVRTKRELLLGGR